MAVRAECHRFQWASGSGGAGGNGPGSGHGWAPKCSPNLTARGQVRPGENTSIAMEMVFGPVLRQVASLAPLAPSLRL